MFKNTIEKFTTIKNKPNYEKYERITKEVATDMLVSDILAKSKDMHNICEKVSVSIFENENLIDLEKLNGLQVMQLLTRKIKSLSQVSYILQSKENITDDEKAVITFETQEIQIEIYL